MRGQIRGLDRGRRAVDVVADPVVCRLPGLGVELEPRGSRIAVAGLADAARVDQPATLGDLEPGAGAGLPTACLARARAPCSPRPGRRRRGRRGSDRRGSRASPGPRCSRLPDPATGRIPRPGHGGRRGTAPPHARRPTDRAPEIGELLLADPLLRPLDGRRGGAGEGRGVELTEHGEVVVADERRRRSWSRTRSVHSFGLAP